MEALQPYASGLRAWYDNEMEISKNYISAKWFLMDSPVLTLQLTAAYLFIVLIGPRIMKSECDIGPPAACMMASCADTLSAPSHRCCAPLNNCCC